MSTEREAKARRLRNAASSLITGRTWAEDAAEFGALNESVLRDEQVAALDIVDAIANMFASPGGEPTVEGSAMLKRLATELTPLAYRSRDGAKARALERIDAAAERMLNAKTARVRNRLAQELLDHLEFLGFPVVDHWGSHLDECARLLGLLQPGEDAGRFKRGAAGLLADLLIGADPSTYPAADRKKIADAIRKASKRGLKTM